MVEFTGETEIEYEDDVEIDFSSFSISKRKDLVERILNGERVTFENVSLVYCGEVSIEVEPDYYYR